MKLVPGTLALPEGEAWVRWEACGARLAPMRVGWSFHATKGAPFYGLVRDRVVPGATV